MVLIKDVIGLALIALAWTNPFGWGLAVRALLFLLGFEVMENLVKVLMLSLSVFFPQTFGYTFPLILIGMFALSLVLKFVITSLIVLVVLRPVVLAVFGLLVSNAPLPSALIGAADFALILLGMKFKL